MSDRASTSKVSMPFSGAWSDCFEAKSDRGELIFSSSIASLITLLLHGALIVSIILGIQNQPEVVKAPPAEPELEIELVTPEEVNQQLVTANPQANTETPERFDNIATQNQQAASEETDAEEDSPLPDIEGDIDEIFEIVRGNEPSQPTPQLPSGAPPAALLTGQSEEPKVSITNEPEDVLEQRNQPTQVSGGQGEEFVIRSDQPLAREDDERSSTPSDEVALVGVTLIPEVEIEQEAETTKLVINNGEAVSPDAKPKNEFEVRYEEQQSQENEREGVQNNQLPRPRISYRATPGPLLNNRARPSKIGRIAIDANFSLMGVYAERMREAYGLQWNLLAENYEFSSKDYGSKVVVQFVITKEGDIKDFEVLLATGTQGSVLLVRDAVLSRAPYDAWTQDMIRLFGDEQKVRITFWYFR